MKTTARLSILYHLFLKNTATQAEVEELLTYFEISEEEDLRLLIADALRQEEYAAQEAIGSHLEHIGTILSHRIRTEETDKPVRLAARVTPFRSAHFLKIAAAILLVSFAVFFTKQYTNRPALPEEITPGSQTATLIMGNGEKLDLNNKAKNGTYKKSGVIIRKTADGQISYYADPANQEAAAQLNTLVTPMGGRYRITLSDGSIVLLNSGSKLEFPVGFHGNERLVKLSGEAYFEVTHDKTKPFIVQSGSSRTQVLGTKFTVSNYPEDSVLKATLLEGKIKFSDTQSAASNILMPGEQATLKNGQLTTAAVNADEATAWKDNKFLFKNEELSVIMHRLSRWYNVDVDYEHLPQRRIYALISMDVNLSEVLRMISLTSGLKFKTEERRITIMK